MFISRYVNFKVQGFVLIIVLLFMQIFAMLSVCIIENHTLAMKMARSYQQKKHIFAVAEKFLASIGNMMAMNVDCEVPVMDLSLLLNQPMDWWVKFGCQDHEEKLQIYYVYEVLQENILRVTVQVFDLQNHAKEILQNTFIKIDNATQSKFWREL
jgi:hypothetical protein